MQADHAHGGKERCPTCCLWSIDTGMCQNGDEKTAMCVVVEPCHDDRQGYNRQRKDGEVRQEGALASFLPSAFARRQKVGQMPATPQNTEEQGSPKRAILFLHTR